MQITTLFKKAFLVIVLLGAPVLEYAQDTPVSQATPASAPAGVSRKGGMSAGVNLGTSGPGLQFSYAFHDNFNARVEFSKMSINHLKQNSSKQGLYFVNDMTGTSGFIGALVDWHPIKKAHIINFTGGIVYNFLKGTLDQTFTYKSGSVVKDMGTLTMDIKVNKVAPYLAVVIGNPVPTNIHRLGVALEVGTYYFGSPKATWRGTGMIEPTSDQVEIVERNLKADSWYPVFTLQVNYAIK